MVLILRFKSLIIWNIFGEFVKFGTTESWPCSLLKSATWMDVKSLLYKKFVCFTLTTINLKWRYQKKLTQRINTDTEELDNVLLQSIRYKRSHSFISFRIWITKRNVMLIWSIYKLQISINIKKISFVQIHRKFDYLFYQIFIHSFENNNR